MSKCQYNFTSLSTSFRKHKNHSLVFPILFCWNRLINILQVSPKKISERELKGGSVDKIPPRLNGKTSKLRQQLSAPAPLYRKHRNSTVHYIITVLLLLSRDTACFTRLHVCPAKTHISLRTCAVWPVFTVRLYTLCILGYSQSALWRLWSDCADAQADLRLRRAHMQSCRKSWSLAHICSDTITPYNTCTNDI